VRKLNALIQQKNWEVDLLE